MGYSLTSFIARSYLYIEQLILFPIVTAVATECHVFQKLKRRKSKQLPEEAAQYPLMYEFMSSEDEETVSKVGFLTEQAERHIKEVSDANCLMYLVKTFDISFAARCLTKFLYIHI